MCTPPNAESLEIDYSTVMLHGNKLLTNIQNILFDKGEDEYFEY